MNRIAKLILLCLPAVWALPSVSAQAQQSKSLPRIGWLSAGTSSVEFPEKQALDGLRTFGWIEGKNIAIEYRYAAWNPERLAPLAAELVGLKVDIIVTFSGGVAAAKRTTVSTPIVIATSQDPVRAGFVSSLARPGGNITGVTFLNDDLAGKRLELLKETLPAASRAAVLWEPTHIDNEFKGMQTAASALAIGLQSIEIPRPPRADEIDRAVQSARANHADALVLAPGGFTILHRKRIIELAAKNRLPAISAWRIFAEDGALFTYGPELMETSGRVGYFVDKILKGAKPGDLPVEQPTKFEFVANLKAAKQIGLTIPPNILARADKVLR